MIALSESDLRRQLAREVKSAEWAVESAALARGAVLAEVYPEGHRFDDPMDTAALRFWHATQRERACRW